MTHTFSAPVDTNRLYKREKLCSVTDIARLFARSEGAQAFMAYPLRVVWRRGEPGGAVRFMITVPKKRLRHAVDRVAMRRRIREAYRLNRPGWSATERLDIAFVYVADSLKPYTRIEEAMRKAMVHITTWLDSTHED